jgi:ribosome-binding protein aMBF1 (putative translation factor)
MSQSPSKYRETALVERGDECEICGSDADIRVHHVNGDRSDGSVENLLVVCDGCHRKIHTATDHGERWDTYTDKLSAADLYQKDSSGSDMVRRSVSIREDQQDWLQDSNINASAFVRDKLDELIDSDL